MFSKAMAASQCPYTAEAVALNSAIGAFDWFMKRMIGGTTGNREALPEAEAPSTYSWRADLCGVAQDLLVCTASPDYS